MGKTHRNQKAAKGPAPQLRSRNTRSSKGRLLTDGSSSTTQLTTQLTTMGLYAAHTVGDGNCLFRALSDQLYGSPSKHHELRQQICDHIALHKFRYEPFVEDDRGLDDHLRAMRENATYGGHMELSAFANMTKRNVKVIQPGLVYVIEYDGSSSSATNEVTPSDSSSAHVGEASSNTSVSTPRRSRKASHAGAEGSSSSKQKVMSEDGKDEVRVKLGKGYYVYEEVTTDEEDIKSVEAMITVQNNATEQSKEPTVYVAYHDWEHFSSIRNLRGPHTGLPNVVETANVAGDDPDISTSEVREKQRKKEWQQKEKERKARERERREKERKEKEQAVTTKLKVKLKVPSTVVPKNTIEDVTNDVPSQVPPPTTPSRASSSLQAHSIAPDPTQIPLPLSRSSSPFIRHIASSSSLSVSSSSAPLQPSSLASEIYPQDTSASSLGSAGPDPREHPRHPHAHVLPQPPRGQYRSPKRTFDESSASGGEDATDEERKRRRRIGGDRERDKDVLINFHQKGQSEGNIQLDVVSIDVEYIGDEDSVAGGSLAGGTETPALSAPGSSTGSSSSSPISSASASVVSASRAASVDPAGGAHDEAEEWDDENDEGDATVVMDGASLSNSITSEHTVVQVADISDGRESFAVPDSLGQNARQKYMHMHLHKAGSGDKPLTRRQRKALGLPKPRNGQYLSTDSLSAGKIVIPGGRMKSRADDATNVTTNNPEWQRNGTGRLDVRGFKELKI